MEPAAIELPPESVGALRTTAANSVKWAIVQVVGATGGRLLFTLVLARFLGPDDFGIVAQAMIYITLAMLLLDQGFGAALVQRRDLHPADARSVATLNLMLSVGLMIVTLICAPLVADFFRTPELTAVLRVLGIGLVLKGLAIVPLMMTRRAFEFRELALLQTSAVMIAGVVSLVAVAGGAGYWALVVQTLVGDGLVLLGLLVLQGLPRFGIHGRSLHGMFRFSLPLLAAQLLSFVGYNADNIIVGRVLGATALAYYALAFRLQRFPLQIIGSAVNDVSLPIFSRLQGHPQRREAWFLTATRFIVLLTWPMLVLIAVAADIAIPFAFGDAWEQSIVPLQLLSLGALAGISRWLLSPLCTSCGRTDLVFRWTTLHVSFAVVGFLISVHWGINAVAASLGIVGVLLAVPQTMDVCRALGMSWTRFMAAHVPVAVGSLILAVLWRAVATLLDNGGVGPAPILIVATVVALAGFAATVRMMWPTVALEVRSMFKLAQERRGQSPDLDDGPNVSETE